MCRVVIETSEGVTGRSAISIGRGDTTPAILAHLINDELAPAVVGEDAFLIRAIRDKLKVGVERSLVTAFVCR